VDPGEYLAPPPPPPPLPSPGELASLAACLADRHTHPEAAARAAFDLWQAAHRLLADEADRREEAQRDASDFGKLAVTFDAPDAFPASLEDFLQRAMSDRTREEREKRFRTFLASRHTDEGASAVSANRRAARELKALRLDGIPALSPWLDLAHAFGAWWHSARRRKLTAFRHATRENDAMPQKVP
jgi:curved DNA-binding protein CbpA